MTQEAKIPATARITDWAPLNQLIVCLTLRGVIAAIFYFPNMILLKLLHSVFYTSNKEYDYEICYLHGEMRMWFSKKPKPKKTAKCSHTGQNNTRAQRKIQFSSALNI